MRAPAEVLFWLCAGLLVYTQLGYGALLLGLDRVRARRSGPPRQWTAATAEGEQPTVSLIIAAYQEEGVIAGKVANARALHYPPDRLEVVVACDGSPDATARLAREAGADRVLELERGGKIRAQDTAVARSRGDIVAFSDANASWELDALRELVAPFAARDVGYVCGQVRFVGAGGANQEGAYWRYEMALRAMESRLASITAGNGAIYATRREAYLVVDPVMGHDLSFPFNMVKRGWRAVYASRARATEPMVPSLEGEFARKRRMMAHTWAIIVRGSLLDPRGYGALYSVMILSHRVLRYASPFLHLLALASCAVAVAAGAGWLVVLCLGVQLALLIAAVLARWLPWRVLLLTRYYVLTTASVAAGLWDWLRRGTEAGWEPAEGTR